MVYFKVLINNKRKNENGVYSVAIRITHNRATTSIATGIRVKEMDWDSSKSQVKATVKNASVLNSNIYSFYAKIQSTSLKLEEQGNFSFEELQNSLGRNDKPIKVVTFDEFTKVLIEGLLAEGKTGNSLVYKHAYNRLSNFNRGNDITFRLLTTSFLKDFKIQLLKEGVRINSISNYLRTIRAIYNRAIKDGVTPEENYPFKNLKIESEPTLKRAITFKDLAKLRDQSVCKSNNELSSINYFFLSIALIGISFTDLAYLKKTDIVDGRIVYVRRKTKKIYSIKLTALSISILANYNGCSGKYILPVLKDDIVEDSIEAHKIIKQWIKTTNHHLSKLSCKLNIGKVTTYVARHSWATTAKRLGYSNEAIAEALGHEYGNRTTNVYLDVYEDSVIDDINKVVLNQLKIS